MSKTLQFHPKPCAKCGGRMLKNGLPFQKYHAQCSIDVKKETYLELPSTKRNKHRSTK